jgi:hypothetical protein
MVREFPGLTDLKLDFGVPRTAPNTKGALIVGQASWRLNGQKDTLSREIPVRVNEFMGVDAIIGKAERKLLKLVYQRLTGSEQSIQDGEVGDLPLLDSGSAAEALPAGTASPAEGLKERMKARKAAEEVAERPEESPPGTAPAATSPTEPPPSEPPPQSQPPPAEAAVEDVIRLLPPDERKLKRDGKYVQVATVESAGGTFEVLVSQVDQKTLRCTCPKGRVPGKGACDHIPAVYSMLKAEEEE